MQSYYSLQIEAGMRQAERLHRADNRRAHKATAARPASAHPGEGVRVVLRGAVNRLTAQA